MALKYIREFAKQLSPSLTSSISALKSELDAEFHEKLNHVLQKLDLIPRHEFDIQRDQLKKAIETLKLLEEKFTLLEKNILKKTD